MHVIHQQRENMSRVDWAQKWIKTSNIPPNGSPHHVVNFNEVTMKSPCHET
jgi:hypothetical protein